jgi:aminoglycoside phosphotransferase (APT) family kinase protein
VSPEDGPGSGRSLSGDDDPNRRRPAGGTEAGLVGTIRDLLGRGLGRPVDVASLDVRPSPFATLFPADVLSVELTDGTRLSLFLKHLGEEQSGHPEKLRRDREVLVYERLLTDPGLPVPRYFGSRWNATTGRREVFLEYVEGWNLKYQDLEHWYTAARRLAHLHLHFARKPRALTAADYLLRFDPVYFHFWARRALAVVADRFPDAGAELGEVVEGYEEPVQLMSGQPPTLVHNDASPKNVVADPARSPARICLVDWEMAGVGCGLLDLVHLKYGLPEDADLRMVSAYREELAGTALLPADPAELRRLLAACELHKTLYRLAFSTTWRIALDQVARWVEEARAWWFRATGVQLPVREVPSP